MCSFETIMSTSAAFEARKTPTQNPLHIAYYKVFAVVQLSVKRRTIFIGLRQIGHPLFMAATSCVSTLDTAKMHGLDTSNVSESSRVEPSGI